MNPSTTFNFSGQEKSKDHLIDLLRQGAKNLIHQAVEEELRQLLQEHQDRRTDEGRRAVVRNGYLPERDFQTGIGPVKVKIPKVRSLTGVPVKFNSILVPPYVRKSKSLETTMVWLYLKGISTGEMESALQALLGPQSRGFSPTTIANLKQCWAEEYNQWKNGLLDDEWVYIWADGIYSGVRGTEEKLCCLVVVGVNQRGEKKFLAIEDGTRESTQSWREVLLQLKSRGMNSPQLAVGDGAMGFWAALEEVFPATKHQRCWVHKTSNVLNCLPKAVQPKAKEALHQIWQAENKRAALKSFGIFVETYRDKYPKAAECLLKDQEELLTFYDFPAKHWQSIRTTNPIESAFATIRHRTVRSKGCLSRSGMLQMIFKLGQAAEKGWRRLRGFNDLEKVITGIKFKDGVEENIDREAA